MTDNKTIANRLERLLDPNCPWGDSWKDLVKEAAEKLREDLGLEQSEKWHKAGWEDGVRHERERSKVLVEALDKILEWNGVNGQYERTKKIVREALMKYEEMGK